MSPDFSGFIPWNRRNSQPEQRIHVELTESARNRIGHAVAQFATRGEIDDAYGEFRVETGKVIEGFDVANSGPAKQSLFDFIQSGTTSEVLTFLELLLNELWSSSSLTSENHSFENLFDLDEKIRRILFEEGILLRLRPNRDTVTQVRNRSPGTYSGTDLEPIYSPEKDESLHFEQISDGTVIEADQNIRMLASEREWEEPLEGYNEAWKMYQDGQFSYVIAEKLYNSLEAVLEEICVQREGWNSAGDGIGDFLSSMRENNLFSPNDAMVGEWQQILGGIQIGVQRLGSDRKRHEQIDQDYAILLLHQTAAFLTFIIDRYEQMK